MIKIQDNFSLHMFQVILYTDYLNSLKLWEGVGPVMDNFMWYKIAELSEISRKKTIFALRRGDHTFENITLSSL